MKKIKELLEKQTVQKLFLCFWMYAVLGWIYEVFLEVVVYKWGFRNLGIMFGPYCPIYAVGALLFLLFFSKFMKKEGGIGLQIARPFIIFFGCMIVATTVELLGTYVLEYFTGSWPWQTYADYKINFQARIALSPALRFGMGGLLFMYFVQPFYDWFLAKPKRKTLNIITLIVLVGVVTDFVLTLIIRY